jgi:hypothetical protein
VHDGIRIALTCPGYLTLTSTSQCRILARGKVREVTSFLCVIAVVGCAPLAQATMQLSFQINGGSPTVCATSPVGTGPFTCTPITGSGLTITNFSAQSSAPGWPTESHEVYSTLDITNTSSSTQLVTLWVSAENFMFPTAPPGTSTFHSEVALTSTTGAGSVGFISCLDTSSGWAPPTGTFCSAGPSLTNVPQSYSGASSEQNTVSTVITSLSSRFSLSEEMTLTLSKGATLNVITSQILTPVVIPEPASIALLGGALLLSRQGPLGSPET